MNYILEIKAFQDEVQLKQLSTGQIALWYALIYINNKCNWVEWFTVANRMLELNSGLSRQGVLVARNALKQYGYIDFKSNGTKATSYKLNPISKFVQADVQDSVQVSVQDGVQDGVQDCSTLNKQNKTKRNEINNTTPLPPSQRKKDKKLFSLDSFEFLASKYLRDSILERIPKANVPKSDENLQSWAIHIDYLKRLDKLTEKEIRMLIKFATTDSFWQSNILSTKNLRKHKDKLMAKMQEKQYKGVTLNDSWRAIGTSSTNKKDFEEYGEEL